ncbi:UDP-glucose 4-epimerase GalE [Allorhizobium taibaishanense]|uniref:UDP-glucose 4-epimerase n=1 Tax=Allorhizobium taibaishanense TaxID=887144 RepID=A0A1Q9A966_9HYPH|nr:UDP-glucose 4-epimerase GalE [Allorhizobium taibaishanense]MBB4009353.1 UDP-glucose 4-epimerase [Allorhizobium taibaishanense]OLP51154.1 UDP-glucose 4-epimerase GalE [Allorhizobium taibaishanense]
MAILVTGGAGYIGSHMVWALVDSGHDVVVLDRLSTGFRSAVAPQAHFYLGDLSDRDLLRKIFASHAIDAIFHFAGSVIVSESIATPMDYYANNTVNSSILIEEAVQAGIGKLVFSSTAAVYGPPADDRPVRETDPLRPQSPYGQSKLMTELMLADTARAHPDFRFVALRYFNVAGCDAKGRTGQSTRGATHLIKAACETALGLRPCLQIFGDDYPTPDGTGIRDYIHVDDLVGAHLRALAYLDDGGPSLTANCGYGAGASVREVIAAVERVAGRRLPVTIEAPRPGDAASVIADPGLAQDKLGWMAENPGLDAIVRTSLDWERRCLSARETPLGMAARRLAGGL